MLGAVREPIDYLALCTLSSEMAATIASLGTEYGSSVVSPDSCVSVTNLRPKFMRKYIRYRKNRYSPYMNRLRPRSLAASFKAIKPQGPFGPTAKLNSLEQLSPRRWKMDNASTSTHTAPATTMALRT